MLADKYFLLFFLIFFCFLYFKFTVSTPHFEPYPNPSPITSTSSTVAAINNSEFQLRKTSSEPNLKMRLRQRLLNKGSSPVTHYQSTSLNNNRPILQRYFYIFFLIY